MCTVSVIPLAHGNGIRLACNRDESRTRPPASPPQIRPFGQRRAIMPVDPVSDGTWVAVNDAGLMMSLLNSNAATTPPPQSQRRDLPPLSRGRIIPSLLHCDCAAAAIVLAKQLRPADYQPFRLVVLDGQTCAEAMSDGIGIRAVRRAMGSTPLLFTSSGLGDDLVQGPRCRLFELMVMREGNSDRQDEFHRHSWPQRPELSVCMSRPDARTVSYTVVELTVERATMIYHPDAPDTPVRRVILTLNLHPVGQP